MVKKKKIILAKNGYFLQLTHAKGLTSSRRVGDNPLPAISEPGVDALFSDSLSVSSWALQNENESLEIRMGKNSVYYQKHNASLYEVLNH